MRKILLLLTALSLSWQVWAQNKESISKVTALLAPPSSNRGVDVQSSTEAFNSQAYSVNLPTAGTSQLVSFRLNVPATYNPRGSAVTGVSIFAGGIGPDGRLLAVNANSGRLMRIDTATGVLDSTGLNIISGTAFGDNFSELVFDRTTSTWYVMAFNPLASPFVSKIYTLNPSTGVAVLVGNLTPSGSATGIVFQP
jgi:hypothetical protein